jgi:anti-sigma28 factor (negative regulator of flagellin synthesis)
MFQVPVTCDSYTTTEILGTETATQTISSLTHEVGTQTDSQHLRFLKNYKDEIDNLKSQLEKMEKQHQIERRSLREKIHELREQIQNPKVSLNTKIIQFSITASLTTCLTFRLH